MVRDLGKIFARSYRRNISLDQLVKILLAGIRLLGRLPGLGEPAARDLRRYAGQHKFAGFCPQPAFAQRRDADVTARQWIACASRSRPDVSARFAPWTSLAYWHAARRTGATSRIHFIPDLDEQELGKSARLDAKLSLLGNGRPATGVESISIDADSAGERHDVCGVSAVQPVADATPGRNAGCVNPRERLERCRDVGGERERSFSDTCGAGLGARGNHPRGQAVQKQGPKHRPVRAARAPRWCFPQVRAERAAAHGSSVSVAGEAHANPVAHRSRHNPENGRQA